MNTKGKKYIICVVGPTAIGKTALGIKLANHYHTDILSADSRQFFREMEIGTAVPSKDELAAAKHHFIQHISIQEPYSVGDFERDAIANLNELFTTKDVVIVVGGSGLYVDAVTKGLDYFPDVDPAIRATLNTKNIEELQQKLLALDPEYYEKVDIANPHRLIRALEICIGTGKPYSSFLNKGKEKRNFEVIYVGLEAERSIIYNRINQRVDIMLENGLLDEVKRLAPYKHLNALQTVGYREFYEYLNGTYDLPTAIEEVKKNTRRFAKRQLTWFRKNEAILWFNYQESIAEITEKLDTLLTVN
ncbi:tRNA (adenosine(37)-N6)-dimethylallyltransferase MiaA [Neptunitalea lumnitzerae]|uniref:tRNA dimethylallyltransferase n=1 Tax=Neptunitalea lumnitzerae TaxID=2965509 RepID=A0ABQ5MK03_9FLAO|nr:tRNA (adenosine(37)-N6)-dimethylallyltransferase MiaA [Neptunitalea sp. Y10]GLB49729.1 tRNA dimethylallyltransferase [Neptunitalea sp. Y10]